MSESAPETGTPDQSETDTSSQPETGTPPQSETDNTEAARKDAAYWKAQADKYERRAKTNADAAKELDRLRREEMPAHERALAEAVDAAKVQIEQELRTQYGGRLVLAEIRAAAKGRLGDEQLNAICSRLNVGSFLTTEGDVDSAEIGRFVDSVMPNEPVPATNGFPDLGQGARHGAGINGDPLLRDLRSTLGLT